ncbi:hypothetical protein F4680DRAFT_471010 [Xylaria scruposa]|nr:hypothetical protein F4680DRAFT_471010 [Xylaria scruposa]
MSSSSRTPLPDWQSRLAALNEEFEAGLSKRKYTPRKPPKPVEDEDIDHDQAPAVAAADGVVLTNGKYRCNTCGSQMKNSAGNIRSHISKLHPKDPSKPTSYMRRQARIPTPCSICKKICSSQEMLSKHIREHQRAEQSASTAVSHDPKGEDEEPLSNKESEIGKATD